MKGNSSLYEFLLMTDESLQKTNKEIWRHLYTFLHTLLNLMIHNFVLRVSHFIKFILATLISLKVTAPFKPVHICLIKSVDPVVYKIKKSSCPVTFCTGHVMK